MQTLYLIRHGQANLAGGTQNYDTLSPLGIEQSKMLAEYAKYSSIRPDLVFMGSLKRHLQTASPTLEKFNIPESQVKILPDLNEFSPTLWKSLSEELAKTHTSLKIELELFNKAIAGNDKRANAFFFKITKVLLEKWKEGFTPSGEESYKQFQERVYNILRLLNVYKKEREIVIFSSGTPISLLISKLLKMDSSIELDWMYGLWNTSVSIFKKRDHEWKPLTINSLPHIQDQNKRSLL